MAGTTWDGVYVEEADAAARCFFAFPTVYRVCWRVATGVCLVDHACVARLLGCYIMPVRPLVSLCFPAINTIINHLDSAFPASASFPIFPSSLPSAGPYALV